ncbi:MAG TPA: hypothetical protein VKE92_09575, partial [Anaerolineales bacterium]|nr:hypothetical protein [Anaerolineales bacterium]
YASLVEALKAAAWQNNHDLNLRWVDAEEVEKYGPEKYLEDVDGVVVPGGFGVRGTEGKISAIQYAREHKIPYYGLCLGMQLAVIEYARNVLGIPQATSEEFVKSERSHTNSDAVGARVRRQNLRRLEASFIAKLPLPVGYQTQLTLLSRS